VHGGRIRIRIRISPFPSLFPAATALLLPSLVICIVLLARLLVVVLSLAHFGLFEEHVAVDNGVVFAQDHLLQDALGVLPGLVKEAGACLGDEAHEDRPCSL
jgi:hypothetical protein